MASIVASGLSVLDSVFGGASQAQKDAARVNRGNGLYSCAASGDTMAARMILYGAQNTKSDSQVGVQHYQALWAQLQQQYPSVAAAAAAAGATPDTTGKGCPGGGLPATSSLVPPPPVSVTAPPVPGVSSAGLTGNTSVLLLAAAAVGAVLLSRGSTPRRRASR